MPLNLGVVSYLNAKPLLHGLSADPALRLHFDVPARLLDGLRTAKFDVALLPVIDYQAMPDLSIIPSGGIGSDGPTLTVRIFSPTPIDQITSLACDTESHTSVALAKIILAERYKIHPRFTPAPAGAAQLLIGDKVITHAPPNCPHQLDLGAAWKDFTGMPFVFAVWTARPDIDLADLPAKLTNARESGLTHIPEIVASEALPRGWPAQLAHEYLSRNLRFEVSPRELAAIELFFTLAAARDLISSPPKPLRLYGSTA